jgi:hypothetical protein
MKTIGDASRRRDVLLVSSIACLCLLFVVLGGCGREKAKVAKVDQANGAVKGALTSVPNGTMIVLCRAEQMSCIPLSDLSDATNRKGEFAISMVPPGHYIIAYAFPNDLSQKKLKISNGDTLFYTFGDGGMQIESKIKNGKWRLDKDASSDTHLIAAGAELAFGSSGLNITNCSVQHKATGLWMEYREGYRYESIEVQPNKIAELILNRWSSD